MSIKPVVLYTFYFGGGDLYSQSRLAHNTLRNDWTKVSVGRESNLQWEGQWSASCRVGGALPLNPAFPRVVEEVAVLQEFVKLRLQCTEQLIRLAPLHHLVVVEVDHLHCGGVLRRFQVTLWTHTHVYLLLHAHCTREIT